MESCVARPRPRERIVGMACSLFHKHGIRGIGVDAIAEAAETNKMTLYRHFGSKDDLIVEYLHKVAADVGAMWDGLETAHPGDPLAQLHAWIRQVSECVLTDGRGCDLANASVELTEADHPARRLIQEVKTSFRNRLAGICRAAGIEQADLLADTLSMLIEGARVSRQSVGPEGPSAQFVRTAERLIASFQVATLAAHPTREAAVYRAEPGL